ncbi:multidrug effflux MFS transporter [Fodinicola acaciae]|uniref:multidrug effflux MFS transporter n=1 Tax=Fodinicola acaciae TaxID=2681555 RepID=UPI001C9E9F44|nr:multidrug effflux MFS transporter [Fodinicola acaciae]
MSSTDCATSRPPHRTATSSADTSAFRGRLDRRGGAVLIILLGGLTALGPLSIDLYLPALPVIAHSLRATEADIQFTLTGMLIGLAVGQVLVGPVSDAIGRRTPLIAGSALHAAASLACFLAPNVAVLDLARILQGLGASAGAVLGLAVVRDLYAGRALAKTLSRMILVMSVSPILAPSIGTALLGAMGWRWLFAILAALGLLLTVLTVVLLPETSPVTGRVPLHLRDTVAVHARLLRDYRFIGLLVVAGLTVVGPFGFVSGAPFVFQHQYHLDQRQFGVLFGVSVAWLFLASQLNTWLLRRYQPLQVLIGAGAGASIAGIAMLTVAATGAGGLFGLLATLWTMLFFAGLLMPNAPAVVLDAHGETAGTTAGLLGAVRWGAAGLVSPLVGLLGNTATAMSAICTTGLIAATLLLAVLTKPQRRATRNEPPI